MGEAAQAVAWLAGLDAVARTILLAIARAIDGEAPVPSHGELASFVDKSVPTVKRHLKALVSDGYLEVAEPARGRRPPRYALGRRVMYDPSSRREVMHDPSRAVGGSPMTRQRGKGEEGLSSRAVDLSLREDVQGDEGSDEARTPARSGRQNKVDADAIPEGFPDHLRPHARKVMAILRQIAEEHGADEVTARRVGLAIMGKPKKPLVETAYELATWAADPGNRRIKDVVSTYQGFLRKRSSLATYEQLDADGEPAEAERASQPPRRRSRGDDRAARAAAFFDHADRLESEGQ